MLEKYLIEHCAPTLASLKTASLFCLSNNNQTDLDWHIQYWNTQLQTKGLQLIVLRKSLCKTLIYVYRPTRLKADLAKPGVAVFLKEFGYLNTEIDYSLGRLQQRFAEIGCFPHEIGIFLGYPLGDVQGFIMNAGKNSKFTGCWKVYCNECETRKLFERFQKCRRLYRHMWSQGKTVLQLTVAA